MQKQSARWLEATWRSGAPSEGVWIALRGASMEPLFRDGDWLRVTPLVIGPAPVPGEVVVARRGTRLVTHRLLALGDGIAITKGDACARRDPPLAVDALLGRVVQVKQAPGWRRIRRTLGWLRRMR